uniref:Uncharacterized protein n=1 Tax=Plectus sambesii TaxID=2011161 RepID=A0A914VF68_9BILA
MSDEPNDEYTAIVLATESAIKWPAGSDRSGGRAWAGLLKPT